MRLEFSEASHRVESAAMRSDNINILPDMKEQALRLPAHGNTADSMQREQELFGSGGVLDLNAFDMMQGNIYGSAERGLLAHKPQAIDASDRIHIAENPHNKLTPKDGQELTLSQLLNDYTTPFVSAYERSKSLKDGEQGKSKTFESIVDRMKACPWADLIRIKFDSHVTNPDYNPVKSTITINPKASAAEQIEQFAHEVFHASHQALKEMYMGTGPLNPRQYAELLGGLEAKTFEAEIHVHNELTAAMGAKPVTYKWRDAHGQKQPDKDLGELYAKQGLVGLKQFILDEAYTDMQISGKTLSSNYRRYYESTQPTYAANWGAAHDELERRFKQDTTLKNKIEQGGY